MSHKLPTLYKKTDKRVTEYHIEINNNNVDISWCVPGGKKQYATYEGKVKNRGHINEKSEREDAEREAKSLWDAKIKEEGYVENLNDDGSSEEIAFPLLPMLYTDMSKITKFDPNKKYYIQAKLDGHRCLGAFRDGKVLLHTRDRDEYLYLDHIRDELMKVYSSLGKYAKDIHFDGELFIRGMSRQNIASILRQKKQKDKNEDVIEYHIFDIFVESNTKMILGDRYKILEKLEMKKPLVKVDTFISNNFNELEGYYTKYTGYKWDEVDNKEKESKYDEGIMIKDPESIYELGKRVKTIIKKKPIKEEKCKIIGFDEGKGSAKGCVIWRLLFPGTGQEFNAFPACETEMKKKMFVNGDKYIGVTAIVQYQDLSDKGVPNFPRVIGYV